MQIVHINGSPRKGGMSATIGSQFIDALKNDFDKVLEYHLNSLSMRGCQECFACRDKKSDRCYIQDGLSDLLEETKKTDIVVVSTPVFYGDISAQLKNFVDRTWSYFGRGGFSAEHLPRNRTLVFILSYGYKDPHVYDDLFDKYRKYFAMFGFNHAYFIKGYGAEHHTPEIVNRKEVDVEIPEIARLIRNHYSQE
ncbi:MAG TPA: flavodoxin family protein [Spirochaetota bacterium]